MHRFLYEKIVGAKVMRGNMRGHLTFYEQMMMQVPGKKDNIDEEKMCTGCPYHRKDFAYRYWGYLEYAEPLSQKEMKDYELKAVSASVWICCAGKFSLSVPIPLWSVVKSSGKYNAIKIN